MGQLRKIRNPSGSASWQIDYYDANGQRHRMTFKKRKTAVRELQMRELYPDEAQLRDLKIPLKVLVKKYKKVHQNDRGFKRGKTFALASILEYFGNDALLRNIQYVHLVEYRQHLETTPTRNGTLRRASTINRQLSCLRHMLKEAVEWQMLAENPFDKGKSLNRRENNQRTRVLSEAEVSRLIDEAADHLKPIIKCAVWTGMRRKEILGLKWEQITDGLIHLVETKTDRARVVPVTDDLHELFDELRKAEGSHPEYVFTFRGQPVKDVKNSFAKAKKEANIKDCTLHDLRHTYATNFLRRGGDVATLSKILGHTTLQMTMRYVNLVAEDIKKAASVMNGFGSVSRNLPKENTNSADRSFFGQIIPFPKSRLAANH
jgi:integrase